MELRQIVQNLQFEIRMLALRLLLYNARHPGLLSSHTQPPHTSALCRLASCNPTPSREVFGTLAEDGVMDKSTSYDNCPCGRLEVIFFSGDIEQVNVQYLWKDTSESDVECPHV
jgi:hypothetical protein